MKDLLVPIATIAFFVVVHAIFGRTASLWAASIVLAYCIGVFWGAGDQKRKQEERDHHPHP